MDICCLWHRDADLAENTLAAMIGPIMIVSGAQHNIATRLVPEPAVPAPWIVVAGFFVIAAFARPIRQQ